MALSMMGGAALADEEYVYGTANLTWEQFWASEGLTYSADHEFAASNETTDTEGTTDLR